MIFLQSEAQGTTRPEPAGFRHPITRTEGAEQTVADMIAALKGAAPANVGKVH